MNKVRVKKRDVPRRTGGVRKDVEVLVYKCPGDDRCVNFYGPEYAFEKGKGLGTRATISKPALPARTTILDRLTKGEIAICQYMRYIVRKSRPIADLECPEARTFFLLTKFTLEKCSRRHN